GQGFLCVLLADAIEVELALNFGGFGDAQAGFTSSGLSSKFLVQHLLAKRHATVADINAGAGDEFFDLRVGFAAKTAQRDVRRPRHRVYSFLSAKLVARSARPGISLRDCTTSSTNP